MIVDFSKYLILIIFFTAFIAKTYLFALLVYRGTKNSDNFQKLFFLGLALIGSFFTDFTWVQSYVRILFFPSLSICINNFIIRIAWALCFMQYQSLGIFIESLAEKNYSLPWYQKLLLFFNGSYIGYFIGGAIFYSMSNERPWFEILFEIREFYSLCSTLNCFFCFEKNK